MNGDQHSPPSPDRCCLRSHHFCVNARPPQLSRYGGRRSARHSRKLCLPLFPLSVFLSRDDDDDLPRIPPEIGARIEDAPPTVRKRDAHSRLCFFIDVPVQCSRDRDPDGVRPTRSAALVDNHDDVEGFASILVRFFQVVAHEFNLDQRLFFLFFASIDQRQQGRRTRSGSHRRLYRRARI